jgi:hypothetical protein
MKAYAAFPSRNSAIIRYLPMQRCPLCDLPFDAEPTSWIAPIPTLRVPVDPWCAGRIHDDSMETIRNEVVRKARGWLCLNAALRRSKKETNEQQTN